MRGIFLTLSLGLLVPATGCSLAATIPAARPGPAAPALAPAPPSSPSGSPVRYAARFAAGSSTSGIQEAIDDCPPGVCTVELPAGTLPYTATIASDRSDLVIEGAGDATVVTNAGTEGVTAFILGGSNVTLRNFKIDGQNATRGRGRGVEFLGTDDTAENLTIVKTPDAAVAGTYPAHGARLTVRGCRIFAPGRPGSRDGFGILLTSVTDARITGNLLGECRSSCIFAFAGTTERTEIRGNLIESGLDNGIRWGGAGTLVRGNVVKSCAVDGFRADGPDSVVEGNESDSNGGAGFKTDGTTGGIWKGNVARSNGDNGFYVNEAVGNTSSLEIRGNSADSNRGAGVQLNPGSARTFTGIVISGNVLTRNTWEGILIAPSPFPSTVLLARNVASGNALGPASLSPKHWTYLSAGDGLPETGGPRQAPDRGPGVAPAAPGGGP